MNSYSLLLPIAGPQATVYLNRLSRGSGLVGTATEQSALYLHSLFLSGGQFCNTQDLAMLAVPPSPTAPFSHIHCSGTTPTK